MKFPFSTSKLDLLGFWAAFICAIHCALAPLVFAMAAMGSVAFLATPEVEQAFIGLSVFAAAISLVPSYLRRHRQRMPLMLALLGFGCIALGHELGHELGMIWIEALLAAFGGGFVAFAHWKNQRLLKTEGKACALPGLSASNLQ